MFLTLTELSKHKVNEAAGVGQYAQSGTNIAVPRIQMMTKEQAMDLRDRAVRLSLARENLKRAAKGRFISAQGALELTGVGDGRVWRRSRFRLAGDEIPDDANCNRDIHGFRKRPLGGLTHH